MKEDRFFVICLNDEVKFVVEGNKEFAEQKKIQLEAEFKHNHPDWDRACYWHIHTVPGCAYESTRSEQEIFTETKSRLEKAFHNAGLSGLSAELNGLLSENQIEIVKGIIVLLQRMGQYEQEVQASKSLMWAMAHVAGGQIRIPEKVLKMVNNKDHYLETGVDPDPANYATIITAGVKSPIIM